MSSALWKPVSMKQLACPSKTLSGSPPMKRRMFSTSVSPSKCVTEPAFEVGRFVASPMAKTLGATLDCRVWGSVATNPSSSPRPGERATYAGPPWSGIVTSRSNGTSRSFQLTSRPAAPSTSPVANSVSSTMPFSPSSPARCSAATGLVKAPSRDVT